MSTLGREGIQNDVPGPGLNIKQMIRVRTVPMTSWKQRRDGGAKSLDRAIACMGQKR